MPRVSWSPRTSRTVVITTVWGIPAPEIDLDQTSYPVKARLRGVTQFWEPWREPGLPLDITHIRFPSETDFPGLPEAHDAFPNPDDGNGLARGRVVFTNRDQIPLGFDPGSCIRGDRLVVDFPDWIYRVRVNLGDTRVFRIYGRNVIDPNQTGYRASGRSSPMPPTTASSGEPATPAMGCRNDPGAGEPRGDRRRRQDVWPGLQTSLGTRNPESRPLGGGVTGPSIPLMRMTRLRASASDVRNTASFNRGHCSPGASLIRPRHRDRATGKEPDDVRNAIPRRRRSIALRTRGMSG